MTLETIQEVLDRQVSQDDQQALERKLVDCINLLGVSAKLKSEAHKKLFQAKYKVMKAHPSERVALLKMIVDAQTAEEQAEFMLAERLNVSLAKAIDGLKAVLHITAPEAEIKWDL
jgi:hypothetical protein